MGKTIVLLDRHVAGHHVDFLTHFAKAFSEHAEKVYLFGPGASIACDRLTGSNSVAEVSSGKWTNLLGKLLRGIGMDPGRVYYLCSMISIRHYLRGVSGSDLILFLPYIYEGELGKWNSLYLRKMKIKWGTLSSEGRWIRHPQQFEGESDVRYDFAKSQHQAFQKSFFTSEARVLCVLDEKIETADLGQERYCPQSKTSVVRIPEIVEDCSDFNEKTVDKINNWAGDRVVVLIAGGLKSGKGLVEFCHSALCANEGFCFVVAGRIFWSSYGPDEVGIIRRAIATAPNLMAILDERLEDQYFNAALRAADLLYLKYENWTNSSNMLSQAVRFRTPVIVSDQFLMGERVSNFNLGLRIGSDDSDPLKERSPEAIRELADHADWEGYEKEHDWNAFREAVARLFRLLSGD